MRKYIHIAVTIIMLVVGLSGASAQEPSFEAMRYYLRASFLEARNDLVHAYTYYLYADRADPGNRRIQLALARVSFNMGDYGKAREFARGVTGDGSIAAEAKILLGEVEYREGDREEAARIFEGLKDEKGVPAFEVRKLLGKIYLEMDEKDKALEAFETARELDPADMSVNYRLGFLYAEKNEIDSAIVAFEAAVRANPGFASAHLALGSMLLHKGRRDEAKRSFREAVRLEPDNRNAVKDLVELYYEDGDFDEGVELLEPLYQAGSLDEGGRVMLGRFYYRADQSEKALEVFKMLLSDIGENPSMMRVISEIELELGHFRSGFQYIKRLMEIDSGNFTNFIAAVLISFDMAGEPSGEAEKIDIPDAEARYYLKEAVKRLDRDSADDNYLIGTVYRKVGENGPARDFLLRAEELKPGDRKILLEIASLYEGEGDFEEALSRVRYLYEEDPADPSIGNFYGYLLARQGRDLDFAEQLLRKALEAQPENGYFLDSLGWIKYRKGEYSKALEILRDATSIVEDDAVIWEHLGDACMKLDMYREAEEAYSRSVSIDPGIAAVKDKLQEVRRLGSGTEKEIE